MKKITAFFLLLLPIFITGLMFISGLIQSKNFPVSVVGISIDQSDQNIDWDKDDTTKSKPVVPFSAHVLPLNAKNQDIIWTISDESIAEVSDGKVTLKDYGRVMVTATAAGNPSVSASREIDSFDYVVHDAKVSNSYDISYLSKGDMAKVNLSTSPSIDHAQKVDSITYSLSKTESKLDDENVTLDGNTGIITVKDGATGTNPSTVYVTVKTSTSINNREKEAIAEATINIGLPVDSLSWKTDNTDETISGNEYETFKNIAYGPSTSLSATDFNYEVDDTDVATVNSETGIVTFKEKNHWIQLTVSYKRNPSLRIVKKLQSSTSELKEVYFNQSRIEIPLGNGYKPSGSDEEYIPKNEVQAGGHPEYILDWITYPEEWKTSGQGLSGVTVESTNPDVIEVINPMGGDPLFKINDAGKCALRISVNEGGAGAKHYSDVCEVVVTPWDMSKEGATPVREKDITVNNTYYFLRNNIKCASSSVDPDTIKFELSSVEPADGATIDNNNILHFNSNQKTTATIRAYVGQDTIGKQFTVTYNYNTQQTEAIDVSTKITPIRVGDKVQFKNNAVPTIEGKYYEKYFDVLDEDNHIFTPKRGCDIPDFETDKGNAHIVVTEDPIYVASEQETLYVTEDDSVDFLNTVNPSVFPSSATKSDGTLYNEPIYIYEENDDCWKIDENIINFIKPGTCKVKVNFGTIVPESESEQPYDITSTYYVRSTYHDDVGKFKVTKNDWARTVMKQYEKWDPTESLRLSTDPSYIDKISISSSTGLCNPTVSKAGGVLTRYIEVKANPISGKYGNDVITISSPTYTFFLNVEVKPTITDFTVTYKQDTWDENGVTTYTPNLKTIRVTPNTIGKDSTETWGWSLNNETTQSSDPLTGTKSIDLSGQTWKEDAINTLYLFNGEGEAIKAYPIRYNKSGKPKVSLYGAEDGIFASCNSSSKSALITTDGYVDEQDFYEKTKFTATLDQEKGETVTVNKNIITITNMPDVDGEVYTNKLTLKHDNVIIKTYDVGRDAVSRIKLPGHNILDQSDKKGMQKVHVYGNRSWYNIPNGKYNEDPLYPGYGTEGEVNYYRVPVVLYDRARKEITDPTKKLNILRNLKITVGRNSAAEIVDADKGNYIRVHFDKNDLYTDKEIYNNAFDTQSGKNIDFQVATKSNEVHADYRFVAVNGVNAWTQDPIAKVDGGSMDTTVLQRNLGVLEKDSKDSGEYNFMGNSKLGRIYGNGYCLDVKYVSRKFVMEKSESYAPYLLLGINIDLNGADNETLTSRKQKIYISGNAADEGDRLFAYTSIHHFTEGYSLTRTNESTYVKNTIFHSFLNSCICINGLDGYKPAIYVENTTFFNSSSFPIVSLGMSPIHFKGEIGVYNFLDKEMLRHVGGVVDLTSFWPLALRFARSANMVHRDYKGDEVINSFMMTALNSQIYFWDFAKNDWVRSERGISGSAKYLAKYADISMPLPIVGRVGASLWGGTNPAFEPDAPKYSDEFDSEGKLKVSFINKQINRWTRQIKFF